MAAWGQSARLHVGRTSPGDSGLGFWDVTCAVWLPRSPGGSALVLRAVAAHGACRAAPAGPRACCPSGPHPSARRPACRRHPAFLRLPARVPTLLPSCSGSDSRLLGRLPRRSGSRPRLEARGTGGGARPAGSHRPAAAVGAAQSCVLHVPRPALPCGSPLAPVRHVARHSSQLRLAALVRPRTLGLTLPGEIKVP